MSQIQSKINSIFDETSYGGDGSKTDFGVQFTSQRHSYLFKPGKYSVHVKLGYYTTVNGLGASPDDVTITGAVSSLPALTDADNSTCNFWRGAENLAVEPTEYGKEIWAVSQATWFRRMHVKGNVDLFYKKGWASGGFIADSKIDGTLDAGPQQQFLTRNSAIKNWAGGTINMVFVGTQGAPASYWPNNPYSVINETPLIREKPYLTIDSSGIYGVVVPALKRGSSGISWTQGSTPSRIMYMSQFYIAQAATDTSQSLNAQLANGKSLILTPGIYKLTNSLEVKNPNTVILGIGLATLESTQGKPAMVVADVDGVSIAGVIFDAGSAKSSTMLQLGTETNKVNHSANPTALFDLVCRVGGVGPASAETCFTLNSNNVLIDNIWLWRADHGKDVAWDSNPSEHGIFVNGDDVTAYGLFVEHFQKHQTVWNGERGATYFYQSELPYDPPNQEAWKDNGKNGYASYKVADGVTHHTALGLGVYGVFTNGGIYLDSAIETPNVSTIDMQHMATANFLSWNGGIYHIINGQGGAAPSKM